MAPQLIICRPVDNINPLVTTSFQVACILVTSHVFQLLLKRIGQPGPVAQLLAGIVVGPSVLSRIPVVKAFFLQASSANYYNFFAFTCRIAFMFLIGLETDVHFVRRNWRTILILASGGSILACVFGASMSWFIIILLRIRAGQFGFTILIMSILANTGSPIVFRIIGELKFDTSNIGRIAIYAALANEMSCILVNSAMQAFTSGIRFGVAIGSLFLIGGVIFANRYLARWFNKRKYKNKHVSNGHISIIVILVSCVCFFVDFANFSSIFTSFLLGVMFPRAGKTARTMRGKLTYGVNTFVIPIYFGYTGFQFNVDILLSVTNIGITVLVIVLGTAAKVVATIAACYHLKIPWNEGLMMGLALNLKGNYDILLIDMGLQMDKWWTTDIHDLFLSIIVLNAVLSGPLVSLLLNCMDKSSYTCLLEKIDPENELRISACVYSPRQVSGQLTIISALGGSKKTSFIPYLIHLVELTKGSENRLMYHQQGDEDNFRDEADFGENDEMEINDYIDAFTSETKILIHKIKDVSSFERIDVDVCNWAAELRTAMVLLPFHKHQRIDGKMELGLEEIRTINQKVIRDAPCSVGIYVDKGQTGFQQPHGSSRVQEAAVVFFGGPDDREALSCARSMVAHNHVNVTLIRFLSAASPSMRSRPSINDQSQLQDDEFIMAISDREIENQKDEAVLEAFSSSYVQCGKARFVEKYVNDGTETAAFLREIGETFSLLIVGKGGGSFSPLTTGMSDWEECPELGLIGDLLASTDMNIDSSLLVIQRNRGKDGNFIGG